MAGPVLKAGGRRIPVSNLDKVLYPGGRFTKQKVIDYYAQVAPVLLPHFKNRPVTLVRYPDGVFKDAFYEKNAPAFTPGWVRTVAVPRVNGGRINYIVIANVATLVWVANLAALELHPFLHRAEDLDKPTHLVFDLDPGEGVDVLTCARVALLIRELLAGLELQAFPKVSGSKGIQVYVPLNSPTTYETSRAFAQAVAQLLAREHSELIVAEMSKALRHGKVFIDWSQNSQTKTTVGVYSLRAKHPQPFVSMPVAWEELSGAMNTNNSQSLFFSPEDALVRIKNKGDLFAPVLRIKQRLPSDFTQVPAPAGAPKALARYSEKRNFSRSPEPEPVMPRRSTQGSRRRFVVQKHAASHLHYDFRLEMHDVLKSWAVPKGLPLKRGERHSAFATEDHPLDYLQFEGIIPEGQYGGGTVMVWDIGTYDLTEGNYWKGDLKIFLSGTKLKGEWALKRLEEQGSEGKARWLVTKTDSLKKRVSAKRMEVSALTGRTIEQIAAEKTATWQSNRAVSQRAPEAEAPGFVVPMKAILVDRLPEGPDWSYEIKWDGYRALGLKHGTTVRLLSLRDKDLGASFPAVVRALGTVSADTALLDGEIVAVNARGQPSFQALQNRTSLGRTWHVVYYAFDLLNFEGEDLRREPLERRRERLESLVHGSKVRFSASLDGKPEDIIQTVRAAGLEGIVAKRKGSRYVAGTRSPDWQKFKLALSQEFVIGGYKPEGSLFSSLLAGYFEEDKLMFAGKVRQGLNPGIRRMLMKLMRPLAVKSCPFANLPISKTGHFGEGVTEEEMTRLRWVKPVLVGQVSFTEWTNYGLLRHATFMGLRQDKESSQVVRETPAQQPKGAKRRPADAKD